MQRSTLVLSKQFQLRTPPSPSTCSVCWRCFALGTLQQSSPSKRRKFSTTRPRFAENIKRETLYDFFPESLPTGPPPEGPFAIDLRQLHKEFLRKQASAHPDRHPKDLKYRAEALSARINHAYKTLQDPLQRAQYILSLRGIELAEDETAKVEDQELLMDVLETQEAIEEAKEEKQLAPLTELNNERLEESVRILERAFAEDDIVTAKREAVRLRYWTNIRDSISSWEPGKPITLIH